MAILRAEPALRINYRFALSSGEPVFEIATLRRPELVLRFTRGTKISVDERLLTTLVPRIVERSRLVALVVIAGTLEVEGVGRVMPGESILVEPMTLERMRSKDAAHLELAWDCSGVDAGDAAAPRRLGAAPMDEVARVVDGLLDRASDQRSTLARSFELFRSAGAPLPLSIDALEGEPSDRDQQFARAVEAQLDSLSSHSHVVVRMGESVGVSERQMQRVFEELVARYKINARSWRDLRNRWRLENAVLLLSRPALTVADVAREVGYASPNALARAFARAGFPTPASLRQQLEEL